jgi:hypothetical protein
MSDAIWKKMIMDDPSMVGPVNPNNGKIEELFKDQGGY